jgi:hypothetical protein
MSHDDVVREWMAQVKCLTAAGLSDDQARAVIAVLSQGGWMISRYPEDAEGSEVAA